MRSDGLSSSSLEYMFLQWWRSIHKNKSLNGWICRSEMSLFLSSSRSQCGPTLSNKVWTCVSTLCSTDAWILQIVDISESSFHTRQVTRRSSRYSSHFFQKTRFSTGKNQYSTVFARLDALARRPTTPHVHSGMRILDDTPTG